MIPRDVRERLELKPGQKMQALPFKGRVELIPLGRVVDLDADLVVAAAELSASKGLPMADSIILATARAEKATLWSQDGDFEGLEGVECERIHAPGDAP